MHELQLLSEVCIQAVDYANNITQVLKDFCDKTIEFLEMCKQADELAIKKQLLLGKMATQHGIGYIYTKGFKNIKDIDKLYQDENTEIDIKNILNELSDDIVNEVLSEIQCSHTYKQLSLHIQETITELKTAYNNNLYNMCIHSLSTLFEVTFFDFLYTFFPEKHVDGDGCYKGLYNKSNNSLEEYKKATDTPDFYFFAPEFWDDEFLNNHDAIGRLGLDECFELKLFFTILCECYKTIDDESLAAIVNRHIIAHSKSKQSYPKTEVAKLIIMIGMMIHLQDDFFKQQKNKENYLNWLKEHPDEENIYDSI